MKYVLVAQGGVKHEFEGHDAQKRSDDTLKQIHALMRQGYIVKIGDTMLHPGDSVGVHPVVEMDLDNPADALRAHNESAEAERVAALEPKAPEEDADGDGDGDGDADGDGDGE